MSSTGSSGSGGGLGGGSTSGPIRSSGLNRPRIPSYNEILPRLYLGDINMATNRDEMTRLGITDMITIEIKPLQAIDLATCIKRYLFINVMDHSKQDILSHFDTSNEFIETALKVPTNKVYVHCVAGISRSASVVIAYVMKTRSMNYSEAFELVSQKRRIVDPNEGFVRQLILFYKMKYSIDISNIDYRRMVLDALVFEFRLISLSYYQVQTSTTSGTGMSATTTTTTSSIIHLPMQSQKNLASRNNVGILFDQYYNKLHLQEVNKYPQVYDPASAFRCNKCRAIVFYAISVIENKSSAAATTSDMLALGAGSGNNSSFGASGTHARQQQVKNSKDCPFIFIEPQPWMNRDVLERDGNLECYKCKRKLGKFDWTSTESCSCPNHSSQTNLNLFKIMRKKVDIGLV